ncbi:thermonuclease family protein, partial [Rhizobiaceae sp. 2RAB30]
MKRVVVIAAMLIVTVAPVEAARRKPFPGPVEATVIDVIDGDTFLAEAHVWPGHSVTVNIRIRGIDAPEMKARCGKEREAALTARNALHALISAATISLSNIAGAKYYGRVLADVATRDGLSVGPALLDRALVRPYAGGKRGGWCG